MSRTTTETLGFADGVIEFLTNPGAPGLSLEAMSHGKLIHTITCDL